MKTLMFLRIEFHIEKPQIGRTNGVAINPAVQNYMSLKFGRGKKNISDFLKMTA